MKIIKELVEALQGLHHIAQEQYELTSETIQYNRDLAKKQTEEENQLHTASYEQNERMIDKLNEFTEKQDAQTAEFKLIVEQVNEALAKQANDVNFTLELFEIRLAALENQGEQP